MAQAAGDGARGVRGAGHRLRGQQHQDRIDAGVVLRRLERGDVALGVGVAEHVHRVAGAGGPRQARAQRGSGVAAERGHLKAGLFHGVRGHRARAAGVGDDQHPVAAR